MRIVYMYIYVYVILIADMRIVFVCHIYVLVHRTCEEQTEIARTSMNIRKFGGVILFYFFEKYKKANLGVQIS